MSDYRIIAVGKPEFVMPYGAAGIEFKQVSGEAGAFDYIFSQDLVKSVFIIDEEIVSAPEKIHEAETRGANVLIIKGWGKSSMADIKIRKASIKAIGTEIKENL